MKIRIPYILRHLTGDIETIETEGQTVGECLGALQDKFPGIKPRLFDEEGLLLISSEALGLPSTTVPLTPEGWPHIGYRLWDNHILRHPGTVKKKASMGLIGHGAFRCLTQ